MSFRRSHPLPQGTTSEQKKFYYHEAKLSFFVTGVDEWLWTSYCYVDTYFDNTQHWEQYLATNMDPSTGAGHSFQFPMWNPREYFLSTLERRVTQATREWTTLVNIFDSRMTTYVRPLLPRVTRAKKFKAYVELQERELQSIFMDDPHFTHTKMLTSIVSAVRSFRDAISLTLEAWHTFEQGQIQHLHTTGSEALRARWERYLATVQGNMSELGSLRSLLAHKLDLFNGLRDGVSYYTIASIFADSISWSMLPH
ncbi:hypothetical protein MPH_06678 [Macrophomina phaseolina MS6]|uniref:Uncharacterized protein n=1 Tax=Macrophomina phaseolina (strain MS6) TaxID=1126212 RepID=K2RTU3_MACPH|nr:hypothetical protein MPH_06678 [Macrophomina phaseolina MS6]